MKPAAQVLRRLIVILHRVEPVGRGLPDVDGGARQWPPRRVANVAGDQQGLRSEVVGDRVAVCSPGRTLDIERPEHRRLGRGASHAVVDQVHEHRETERVREQDELLPLVATHLAGIGEKADTRDPLRLGERLLHGELVEVTDKAADQLPQARIGTVGEALDHLRGEGARCGQGSGQVVAHSYPT